MSVSKHNPIDRPYQVDEASLAGETSELLIPQHVQIETINGVCSARCTMCSYKEWKRTPRIMENQTFRAILNRFLPYQDQIEFISMQGWGEPLLDKGIPEKVKIAKEMGFRGVGFASNATHLDEEMSRRLIDAELDSIIVGIDGIKKETHEAIRTGTNFDEIVANVKRFISIRNQIKSKTHAVIRFIRQTQNIAEWPAFQEYWLKELDQSCGDNILVFDIHNCAGTIENYNEYDPNHDVSLGFSCDELMTRIVILSNGDVAFCCADINGFYDLGNAATSDPIAIFNNEVFNRIRSTMETPGGIMELEHCKECTIPRSRALKIT